MNVIEQQKDLIDEKVNKRIRPAGLVILLVRIILEKLIDLGSIEMF